MSITSIVCIYKVDYGTSDVGPLGISGSSDGSFSNTKLSSVD